MTPMPTTPYQISGRHYQAGGRGVAYLHQCAAVLFKILRYSYLAQTRVWAGLSRFPNPASPKPEPCQTTCPYRPYITLQNPTKSYKV